MRRLGLLGWLLMAAACLDAPPASTSDVILTGMAAREPLTLDGRDELVIIGSRGGAPVAFVLFPGDTALPDARVVEVSLPFDPKDVEIIRWLGQTGLALLVGPAGELAGIDQEARLLAMPLTLGGMPYAGEAYLVGEVNLAGDRHIILADEAQVLASARLGGGAPGENPVELFRIADSGEPLVLGATYDQATGVVGLVGADQEIDVYTFTGDPAPQVGLDIVDGDLSPTGLERPSWRMFGGGLVLIGADADSGTVWWHRTDLESSNTVDGSFAIAADLALIHDVMVTLMSPGGLEIAVLGEQATGELRLLVYLNPSDIAVGVPAPLTIPVAGLTPPVWLQAVDAVLEDDPGMNEIVVYDSGGRMACIDLDSVLVPCGEMNIGAAAP